MLEPMSKNLADGVLLECTLFRGHSAGVSAQRAAAPGAMESVHFQNTVRSTGKTSAADAGLEWLNVRS